MDKKYFKKIYPDRVGYGKWKEGEGINYIEPQDGKYTIEFITKNEYEIGIASVNIPEQIKENYISNKIREIAIEALKIDGILDANGDLIV